MGESKITSIITKTNNDTSVSIKVTAHPLLAEAYAPEVIPTNPDAVIVLGDNSAAGSRWEAEIHSLIIKSTNNSDFGVLNAGIISDSEIYDLYIYDVQHAFIVACSFTSQYRTIRMFTCGHGSSHFLL